MNVNHGNMCNTDTVYNYEKSKQSQLSSDVKGLYTAKLLNSSDWSEDVVQCFITTALTIVARQNHITYRILKCAV